jgi:hypothetical protein
LSNTKEDGIINAKHEGDFYGRGISQSIKKE